MQQTNALARSYSETARSAAVRGLIILAVLMPVLPASAGPEDDDVLGQFLNDTHSHKHAMDADLIHSASFDNWLKHYLNGQDDAAQKDWQQVLKGVKGEGDLHSLFKQAVIRLSFSSTGDDNPRRNSLVAMQKLLDDTEKFLDKNNPALHDGYDYAANIFTDGRLYNKAILYKQKEVRVEEAKWGPNDPRLCLTLCHLAEIMVQNKQYDAADKVVARITTLNKNHGDIKVVRRVKAIKDRVAGLKRIKSETPGASQKRAD